MESGRFFSECFYLICLKKIYVLVFVYVSVHLSDSLPGDRLIEEQVLQITDLESLRGNALGA